MPPCPECGATNAYIGIKDIECSNPKCRHYKQNKKKCPNCKDCDCDDKWDGPTEEIVLGKDWLDFLDSLNKDNNKKK